MEALIDRIGETNIAKNGQKMTIIAYRNSNDIDVQFEDGIQIYNKPYASFKKGHIANPNVKRIFQTKSSKRLGEINLTSDGHKMKIIGYRTISDIDVEFENGEIRYHTNYNAFKNGKLKMPLKSKIGEEIIANCGLRMKIIAYRTSKDLDVLFEDGTLVEHKGYKEFKRGRIRNPKIIENRTGESLIAVNGQKMTIIAYHNSRNVDIKFEDGTIVTNKNYNAFLKGEIANPNFNKQKNIGLKVISSNGLEMEVIEYINCDNISVKFEDGYILKNQVFEQFKRAVIRHPLFRKGNTIFSNDYFGYKVKKIFENNTKIYYEAYKNGEFIALMTLQEIYQMAGEQNG